MTTDAPLQRPEDQSERRKRAIATWKPNPIPTTYLPIRDGGEMGRRIREFDWGATNMGPMSSWSPELVMTINTILAQRFPITLFIGPDRYIFYNDAYIDIVGAKHPVIGQTVMETWPEIYSEIDEDVQAGYRGETSWNADRYLPMQRSGFVEEVYFTWSMSPIIGADGKCLGILAPSFEVTSRVLQERQERCIRDLGSQAGRPSTVVQACTIAAECVEDDPGDIPYSLIYLVEGDGAKRKAVLQGASGIDRPHPCAPETIEFNGSEQSLWPIPETVDRGQPVDVHVDKKYALPGGLWPEPSTKAVCLPIKSLGSTVAVVILGISPRRSLNDLYRNFHELIARQLANNLNVARSYEEEKQKREALSQLDRAKTAFFSSVSHEFKTPLTLILGPVEETLKKDLPADVKGELKMVHRNALRLLKLVNSLLDFTRIEARRMQAAYVPTDITSMVVDLCGVFRSAMERAGLRFTVDASPIGEPVYIDIDMFEKIVFNLLSNALKCTLAGEITVSLTRTGNHAVLAVKDTGLGISEAHLNRIFERFYRVEAVGRRSNEGSGIGLALTQELVKLHGGTIQVVSELGTGSVFTVTLPLGKSHLPREHVQDGDIPHVKAISSSVVNHPYVEEAMGWLPGKSERPSHGVINDLPTSVIVPNRLPSPYTWSATGAKCLPDPYILVADDNADMSEYLRSLLSTNWRISIARDGQEAWEKAKAHPPGLILSDVMMPRIDGFELVRKIRADADLSLLPIILLSARAGEEARVEGLEIGADDYMAKPFGAKELVARVRTHLELGRLRNELEHLAKLSPVGIFRARSDGDFVYRSQRLVDISGADLQSPFLSTVHPEDREMVAQVWKESCSSGTSEKIEFRYLLPNGKTTWVLAQWAPERDESGQVLGVVGAVTDVTERVEAQKRQLQEAEDNRKSQEALIDMVRVIPCMFTKPLTYKTDVYYTRSFAVQISHEIRNPINAIYNNIDLIRMGLSYRSALVKEMDALHGKEGVRFDNLQRVRHQLEEDEEALNAISLCCQHQRLVADEVLHLTKLKSGNIVINTRIFDPRDVVNSIVTIFKAEMEAKQIELETNIQWEDEMRILGDPDRLSQVLVNLTGNAVKFTEKCPVRRIRLNLRSNLCTKSNSVILELAVSDTGIGMTMEAQRKLFKRFSQASIRTHREYGGTGLGLHLSKQMAQLMGGDVVVQSEVNKGSTFIVTVRCERAKTGEHGGAAFHEDETLKLFATAVSIVSNLENESATPVRATSISDDEKYQQNTKKAPIHVLVVEDNLINQRVLRRQLEVGGFRVTVANNGKEAVDQCLEAPSLFSLILMDLEMPVMDGLVATEKIREWEREEVKARSEHVPIPIIGVSGNARLEYKERALTAGMNDYVVKPYEKQALFDKIKIYAKQRRTQ